MQTLEAGGTAKVTNAGSSPLSEVIWIRNTRQCPRSEHSKQKFPEFVRQEGIRLRHKVVDNSLTGNADINCSEDTLVENLLDALPPGTIDICIPEAFRRELNAAGQEREVELITFLRDGLYVELGVLYPQFWFVVDEDLKPNGVAFRINYLTTLPLLCLRPDQCLVNDTVERLRLMDVEGRATPNPATWQPCAIVDAKHKDTLEAAGLTTWDQWSFLIMALAGVLRKNAGCFVHRTFTQLQLSELRTAFPAVTRTVLELFPVDAITGVLRMLVREEVSIRDLRFVCEALLDYRYRSPDACRYIIFDVPGMDTFAEADDGFATNLVSFVRTRLYRPITFKHRPAARLSWSICWIPNWRKSSWAFESGIAT